VNKRTVLFNREADSEADLLLFRQIIQKKEEGL